jgi:hypothetical protein
MNLLPFVSLLALVGPAYSATLVAQYGLAGNSNEISGNGFNGVDTDMLSAMLLVEIMPELRENKGKAQAEWNRIMPEK